MAKEPQRQRKPVTGTFNVPKDRRESYPASHAFDEAWARALRRAAEQWRNEDGSEAQVRVRVEYTARVDVWNPGGIGVCGVTLTPL
jgi:hypothetical protein